MFARVLLPLALVLALAGTASAEKAKLAVLGLEVAGSIDTDSTSHGRLLTERFRAKIGISARYMLAPNSMKDLLDEKVAISCDNEAPDCMSKIGGKLKASFLMYGKIEKRPKDGKEGYQLSMKLLDVDKKAVKEWGDWLPLTDFVEPGALDVRVAAAYDTLTKDAGGTDIVITGPTGPGPGPAKPPKGGGGGFPWKVTAVATSAVALAALGGFIYLGPIKTYEYNHDCELTRKGEDPGLPGSYIGNTAHQNDCATNGPKFGTRNKIVGVAAAAVGGLALFAIYKGFIAKKETSTQTTSGRTRKKKQFAVTPIISPEGGGATFRLDW